MPLIVCSGVLRTRNSSLHRHGRAVFQCAIYCLVCARLKNPDIIASIDCYMEAYLIHKLVASNINFAYGILDVKDCNASVDEIKKCYKLRALMFHPDKFHSVAAEGAMKITNATWELLSDPRRREEYNKMMGYAP
ncbi:hypothetical protein LWI29_009428 [Acer saccharum]|uniref:J domain-containing protein n=1 Tax=Acer saccharum TaxID=4024 RepID=A0AA39VMB3_ACESA|nr:hypothetical protein LWI29_009428 [Acer saccharum]